MNLRKALARIRRARNNNTNGSLAVQVGSENIAVHPLGIENTIQVAILLAPYLVNFGQHLTKITAAVVQDRLKVFGDRSTLRTLVEAMVADLDHLPGDIVKMLALFLGREPEWVARNATAHQLVAAIPVIDEANDLAKLIHSIGMLGFIPDQPITGDDHG